VSWSRLRTLSLRDWCLVAVIALTALVVEIGLRVLRLPCLARLAGAPLALGDVALSQPPVGDVLSPRLRRELAMVRRVMTRWPWGDTCLRIALVAGHRLRRLSPSLRVGVAIVDGEVRAHAWLEVHGISLDPSAAKTFSILEPSGR
jgi:hypothetical protein